MFQSKKNIKELGEGAKIFRQEGKKHWLWNIERQREKYGRVWETITKPTTLDQNKALLLLFSLPDLEIMGFNVNFKHGNYNSNLI